MRYEYRVVPYDDLGPLARVLQRPSNQRREYAAAVEGALNRMDADGWHMLDSFTAYNGLLFVFRRECLDLPETGIKPADR